MKNDNTSPDPRLHTKTESALLLKIKGLTQIDPETGCWNFQGRCYAGQNRYPTVWWEGKMVYVHRTAHDELIGPATGFIHHTCDNVKCWNPHHLKTVTPDEHQKHMMAKQEGRAFGWFSGNARRGTSGKTMAEIKALRPDMKRLRAEGMSADQIARQFNIGRSTVYRALKDN